MSCAHTDTCPECKSRFGQFEVWREQARKDLLSTGTTILEDLAWLDSIQASQETALAEIYGPTTECQHEWSLCCEVDHEGCGKCGAA